MSSLKTSMISWTHLICICVETFLIIISVVLSAGSSLSPVSTAIVVIGQPPLKPCPIAVLAIALSSVDPLWVRPLRFLSHNLLEAMLLSCIG